MAELLVEHLAYQDIDTSDTGGLEVDGTNKKIKVKKATTTKLGGIKPDGTTTSVNANGIISTINRASTSTQIIAGAGLTGGGDLSANRTLNVVSANDGIVVNADNIELVPNNTLTSTSISQALSSNMGKTLQDTKLNLSGGTLTGTLNGTAANFSGNVKTTGGNFSIDNTDTSAAQGFIAKTGKYTYHDCQIYESDDSSNYFRMYADHTYCGINYYSSGGLSGISKTLMKYNKTTGALEWAGGTFTGGVNVDVGENAEPQIGVNRGTRGLYLYDSGTYQGIWSSGVTGFGDISLIIRNVSTGVITFAPSGAIYGSITGSTANFSGNITAPKLTMTSAQGTGAGDAVRYDYLNTQLGNKLNLSGGTLTGTLNGSTASFSGNVTAPNLAYNTTQIIAGTGLVGGGDLTTNRTINIVSANAGIVVNSDNIELKPATTSIIGGVKPDGTTTSVDVNGVISTVNRASTSTQIIAGLGLTGGGDLTTNRTINIVSANDGIIANADNIQLDTQNTLTSTSTTKPLSANMGKVLQDTKLNLTGGTLTGALNGSTATFSGNVTAPNIITDTSVGTCTTLFSGTQQCGQNTWKDTGIDIPTTYSSVLIGVNIASSGIYDIESEFSRCTLTRGQTLVFTHQAENERIMVKILGNRLWTYTSGNVMTDNNLKTVVGITRR